MHPVSLIALEHPPVYFKSVPFKDNALQGLCTFNYT